MAPQQVLVTLAPLYELPVEQELAAQQLALIRLAPTNRFPAAKKLLPPAP